MDDATRGASAIASGDFPTAITLYTKAISSNPSAVDYYIKRSTAYTRISPADHKSALSDAEIAVSLAHKRGKRELLAQSQLRRGIALFSLEKWADAQQCFKWVSVLNDQEKSLKIWGIKVENKLSALEDGDERKTTTVKEIPEVEIAKEKEEKSAEEPTKLKDEYPSINDADSNTLPKAEKLEPVQTPASKIRHDWYQTSDNIVITLLVKGVPIDRTTVDIQSSSVSISFPLQSGSDFLFTLDPLFAIIDAAASSSRITSAKIELKLRKLIPGQKWPSLEGREPLPSANAPSNKITNSGTATTKTTDHAPSYPTSSRTGPKNWDKVAADLTKSPKKDKKEGDEDQTEDDSLDDFEGGDPVNGFFQQLYKGADPDTRRAMMKSYQESNGTALSTNWAEVGKGKVETTPPEGMEAKKW